MVVDLLSIYESTSCYLHIFCIIVESLGNDYFVYCRIIEYNVYTYINKYK